jgi:hypothetical protein
MWRRSLVVTWLCAGVAYAQPTPQQSTKAREHFNRAQAAEKDGRFRDAIDEYEQAYALVPHVDVLYNIAFDYEKLDEFGQAADYYQRYLDERTDPPPDADKVRAKIRDLRAKAKPMRVEAPPPPVEPTPEPFPRPSPHPSRPNRPGNVASEPPPSEPPPGEPPQQPPSEPTQPTEPAPARWHAGVSYGFGFGASANERYSLRAGIRVASVVELDAILGSFGNNDYAAGALARVVVLPHQGWSPFARGAVTIGYARQDASSRAETRSPLGFEAGGGIQFGHRSRFEIDAVVRWLSGGFDATSTTAFSYVNDEVAFAIDLGFSFDMPIMAGGR